jgi:hypothetical protein
LKKYRTFEQTEAAQARAVRFAQDALENLDLAGELESLTPEEYADRKGIVIGSCEIGTPTDAALRYLVRGLNQGADVSIAKRKGL